jgi:hypothetical protein
MMKVFRKGWDTFNMFKDNSHKEEFDPWKRHSGNPLYNSEDEDEDTEDTAMKRKAAKNEPMFFDDSGYEGSNSAGVSPLDEVPPPMHPGQNNSAPSLAPSSPNKHPRKHHNATVLSPLACRYTISQDGSRSSSVNSSATHSLSTSLDTELNNSVARQNTIINAVLGSSW